MHLRRSVLQFLTAASACPLHLGLYGLEVSNSMSLTAECQELLATKLGSTVSPDDGREAKQLPPSSQCPRHCGGRGGRQTLHERVPGVPVHDDKVVAAHSMKEVQPHRLHGPAHCYKGVWDQLSTREGPDGRFQLILDGAHIVVLCRARERILELLHRPDAGVVKTQQAARQLYYCPRLSLMQWRNESSARRPCPASR